MTDTMCQCEHISHFPEYSARMRELGVQAAHEYGKAEVHGLYSVKTSYGPYAMCPACKDAGHMGYKGEVQP